MKKHRILFQERIYPSDTTVGGYDLTVVDDELLVVQGNGVGPIRRQKIVGFETWMRTKHIVKPGIVWGESTEDGSDVLGFFDNDGQSLTVFLDHPEQTGWAMLVDIERDERGVTGPQA